MIYNGRHYFLKNKSEEKYIKKRKFKARISKLCFYICRIFPIDTNMVSVCTFEGRGGFGCNPKYIVEAIHKIDKNIKIIWLVNDMSKEFPDYIQKIHNTFWNRALWLSRSKVWIDNYRKPYGTVKRRGQYYVNTWHANLGFKTIGLLRGEAFSLMAYLVSKNDSEMIDDVVVDSDYCETMFKKGLLYDGNYLKVGQPRCDVLYVNREKYIRDFRNRNNLPINSRIVMFAPTFREKSHNGKRMVFSEVWSIDFKRMLENLEKRFDGDWYLCVRVHPQLADTFSTYQDNLLAGKIVDASKEDDMYQVLAAMDAFVTDYSSAAFDASYCHMPVFIYADDIEKYTYDRGELLWEMSSMDKRVMRNNPNIEPDIDAVLPFPIATNNDELENIIIQFDEEKYFSEQKKLEEKIGLVFDGRASEKVAEKILEVMK